MCHKKNQELQINTRIRTSRWRLSSGPVCRQLTDKVNEVFVVMQVADEDLKVQIHRHVRKLTRIMQGEVSWPANKRPGSNLFVFFTFDSDEEGCEVVNAQG